MFWGGSYGSPPSHNGSFLIIFLKLIIYFTYFIINCVLFILRNICEGGGTMYNGTLLGGVQNIAKLRFQIMNDTFVGYKSIKEAYSMS